MAGRPSRPNEQGGDAGRGSGASAELISALVPGDEPSSATERVVCEHADRCGGCPVIGLPYGEQLSMKRGRVVQSASRYSSLELVYTEPVAAAEPIVEYRTRAKL